MIVVFDQQIQYHTILMLILSTISIIYLTKVRPHQTEYLQKMELFNEYILLL